MLKVLSARSTEGVGSNLCPDEKGTERYRDPIPELFSRSNLCPDEKGTERQVCRCTVTIFGVATYAPMKRGLKDSSCQVSSVVMR